MSTEDGKFDLLKYWQTVGGYDIAKPAYEKSLAVFQEQKPNENENLNALTKLADFFYTIGQLSHAASLYKTVLTLQEKKYSPEFDIVVHEFRQSRRSVHCIHPEVLSTLNKLGSVYESENLDETLKYFTLVRDRLHRVPTANAKIALANSLIGTSNVYRKQKNAASAFKLYLKSLELAKDVLGSHHPFVASIYNEMGQTLYEQGRLQEARNYYLRDLQLTRKEVGVIHPYIGIILSNIGMTYDEEGDITKARTLYQAAIDILRNAFGNEHVDVALVRYNLGGIFLGEEKYRNAEYHFTKSANIFKKFYGENHPDTKLAQDAAKNALSLQ